MSKTKTSKTYKDRVRTFCMNPYGEVIHEEADSIITVNGHSYSGKKTDNTNFAILVSTKLDKPFNDAIKYGKSIASLANHLSKGIILQRLGDLLSGQATTENKLLTCTTKPSYSKAAAGDLGLVLPYRHLMNIIEMLEKEISILKSNFNNKEKADHKIMDIQFLILQIANRLNTDLDSEWNKRLEKSKKYLE